MTSIRQSNDAEATAARLQHNAWAGIASSSSVHQRAALSGIPLKLDEPARRPLAPLIFAALRMRIEMREGEAARQRPPPAMPSDGVEMVALPSSERRHGWRSSRVATRVDELLRDGCSEDDIEDLVRSGSARRSDGMIGSAEELLKDGRTLDDVATLVREGSVPLPGAHGMLRHACRRGMPHGMWHGMLQVMWSLALLQSLYEK